MRSLFEIGNDLRFAFSDIEDEIGPELEKWFSELESEESKKLDNYVSLIRHWEMESAAAKAEAAAYAKRAASRDNRIAQFKERLRQHLLATGRTEVITETGRPLRIAGNGGLSRLDVKIAEVPDDFMVVRREPDMTAIRESLESGASLPFAVLLPRGNHIRIG